MRSAALVLLFSSLTACGGTAVIDGDGSGGIGGAGGSSTASTSTGSSTTSTSSGPTGCTDHNECPPNAVCLYGSGTCALVCGDDCESCPAGEVCNDCATGSCPQCLDCVAACVPASPGQCDDHDDCASDESCVFSTGQCEPLCSSSQCADPNLVCADCATSSCPCCEDCQSVCLASP